ncbi:MAG: hypothetical protein U0670_17585 [Anaerolineae bacterium]
MKTNGLTPYTLVSLILVIMIATGSAVGQEVTPLSPESLFAPGIEVVHVEWIPPYTPTYIYASPTPIPTEEPRCGYLPYPHVGETDDWSIDYIEPLFATPLILCNRTTGERREVQVGQYVENIAISPDQRYAVLVGYSDYFGYDFQHDQLIPLSDTGDHHYDGRDIRWYGNTTLLIYEAYTPDSAPWLWVSLADVTEPNSLTYLATLLKYTQVSPLPPNPDFTTYHDPGRAAWVDSTEDGGCSLNWIVEATGDREAFDITGICVVGEPLSDDPYGDYLFMPIQYRVLDEEPVRHIRTYSRDLVRMNLTTGERDVWYEGEVERLNDLDPSQRYATLIIDHNGCVDLINDDLRYSYDTCRHSTEAPDYTPPTFEAALLDTTTHEIIYRHAVTADWGAIDRRVFHIDTGLVDVQGYSFSDPSAAPGGDLFSMGENQFIFFRRQTRDSQGVFHSVSDTLLTVEPDNTVIETPLPGQLLLAGPENAYFVLLNTDHDLLLVDRQGNSRPFISGVNMSGSGGTPKWGTDERYDINLTRGDTADEIQVRLSGLDGQGSIVYTVRVP